MNSIPGTGPASAVVTSTVISAREITKSYAVGDETLEILHGISLDVVDGEMVAIMGPPGSGKSTLMYCLAGLEETGSGEVSLLGRSLRDASAADRAVMRRTDVGFVFQAYNLMPTMNAYDNVALPYLLRGEKAPDALIRQTLTTVGLADRIGAMPASMSGGEQQRVALARVLAQQPRIVFADEPTGALDTRSGEVVLGELQRVAHSGGHCVVVVTHDPEVAARCDRVLFLRDGSLVEERRGASSEQVAAVLVDLGRTGRPDAGR